MISDIAIQDLYESSRSMYFGGLWSNLDLLGDGIDFPYRVKDSFDLKKEIFFEVILRFYSDGRLLFSKNGELLGQSLDVLLTNFRNAFPLQDLPFPEDVNTWFDTDSCPVSAVWVYRLDDGSDYLEWT